MTDKKNPSRLYKTVAAILVTGVVIGCGTLWGLSSVDENKLLVVELDVSKPDIQESFAIVDSLKTGIEELCEVRTQPVSGKNFTTLTNIESNFDYLKAYVGNEYNATIQETKKFSYANDCYVDRKIMEEIIVNAVKDDAITDSLDYWDEYTEVDIAYHDTATTWIDLSEDTTLHFGITYDKTLIDEATNTYETSLTLSYNIEVENISREK